MTKIAIIGTSNLFPGSSTTEEFWKNLMQEKDLTSLATREDFGADPQQFFHSKKGAVDKCYSLRGGYIRDFKFDPNGYELPADLLAKQDKLYQWSLYVAKEALKDSGYDNQKDLLKKCGVILGNLSFPTSTSHQFMSSVYTQTTEAAVQNLLNDKNFKIKNNKQHTQNDLLDYTPSQMVTKALGLGANHYTLDAACATSLYAIKLACDELVTGKSDMMLAGAVCASDQLFIHMGFSIFHAYAPHEKKFVPMDKDSAGLVSSEGAGMVVLKRLEDAEADNDNILAVIGGIGLSNDGRGKFLLSPHPKGQRLAFERAYQQGNILAKDTDYLECHATGTPLGDVTELNSISDFFASQNVKPLLGSVKSNMGHLLTAAGMTGLLKVLLSMQHEIIPSNINLEESVKAENGWMGESQLINKATPWTNKNKQAGINSFGFGGTNAHMVVQNYNKNQPLSKSDAPVELQPMSIIGMDAHFGDCTNLEDFYSTIYHGKQHFKKLPKGRWKGFEENKKLLQRFGFENGEAPKGAYIENFEIDLLRYKIQPKEAETLEPQQALILKVADHAIKDAGLNESSNVAVLIAMESELAIHHYLARWDVTWQLKEALKENNIELTTEQEKELEELCKDGMYFREGSQTPSQHTSFVGNIMASRIAALWDFSGPAFTVSSGENSVFKALEIAQNLLSLGEVDAVVVGGVDFAGGLENVLLRNQKNKINQNGHPSISLNKGDEGWLVGEGAGAIVLKKTSEAKEDKVYATINSIGKNLKVQNAGYHELANTGIDSEDNKELYHLNASSNLTPVALGSVKANIGHTYAASGIASLIKTALCLHHRFIPAIPNWKAAKNASKFQDNQFYFPSKSRPWILQNDISERRAIVNGLENIQVQMTESTTVAQLEPWHGLKGTPNLFALKGNSEKEIKQQISALEIAIETATPITEIAQQFFQKSKEKHTQFCAILIAKNKKDLTQEINFFQKNINRAFEKNQILKTPRGSYFSPDPLGKKGKVAFVYPGSSTAYTGLGRDLFQLFPQLYSHFEKMLPNLDEYIWSDYLFPKKINATDEDPNIYNNAIAMMSTGVFYSVAFTHILQEVFGVKPEMAFGYSMGECSSMWYALGVWSSNEAREFQDSPIFKNRFAGNLELLAETWGISPEEAKERWVSLVLLAPREKVEQLIKGKDKVYLTFVNTKNEVVISGDKKECLAIAEALKCQTVTIPFQNIIHHDFCKKEEEGLLKMHSFDLNKNLCIDFYSSITQEKIPFDSQLIAENSTAVCCQKVDFPKTVNTLLQKGANIFIELGANATCTGWINNILKEKEHLTVSINQKGKADAQAILEVLTRLVSHGVEVDLSALFIQPKEGEAPRSFMKKIEVGGQRIFDLFEKEKQKGHFKNIKRKAVSVIPLVQKGEIKKRELAFAGGGTDLPPKDKSIALIDKTIHLQKDKNNSNMEVTTIKNKPSTENEIGENGLRLQNFESGEQLKGKEIIFSQKDLEEFATGKIANVFGPEYSIIDTYSRRVMLPMNPYLLVSRVTGLKGEKGKFEPSTMQTEYDIPYNAWFTTDRQIPWAVSVESGQCDLLLISYLGIDFQNKGDLVYRLLDCTLTFTDDLPFEGQTLRYDISIDSFIKNGDNLLFFFSYRCYVEDRLVLKMDGGCAGFFSDEQLEEGNGVIYTDKELEAKRNAKKRYFTPLLNTPKTSFSKEDLRHLINGDMEKCFDDISYFANERNPSLCLPPEKILMIDRITSVDLTGGAYGLGYIVAEKNLSPDDWYFPCHFRDDEVLAGSLQAEGGGNLLRFFMLMLGLQRLTKDARYQPIFDLPQKVRCRKQVTPGKDTKLIYKLEIKEIGLIPNPYVIGDLEIISDGVVTVHFENLGLQLREKTNPRYLELEDEASQLHSAKSARSAGEAKSTDDGASVIGNSFYGMQVSPRSEGALMNELDITTFALDDLSKCFGSDFAIYDGRKVSRQPNTDLQVISRIISVDGTRKDFSKPSKIHAEYDVPVNAWYYEQNSAATMPYSILMEIALQPCGLLGAYLGSTLQFSDENLYFRNLDGNGEMFDLPNGTDFRGKTITNHAALTSSVALGGTILQNYTFECSIDGHVFYKGKSSFGFFPGEMLATQVGLDGGKNVDAWYVANNLQKSDYMQIKLDSLFGKMKLYKAPADKPHYRLAENQLNLIDNLIIAKDGGEHGKGYVHATKFVMPYEWFYTCHFYQDPVMPGSLGVEAILQAMQVFALQQDLGKDFSNPKFVQLPNHETSWKYRGQILTHVREMQLEVHFKSMEIENGQMRIVADASLWNDEVRIYQLTDLALGIEEA